jgi:hypothetical protein
MPLRIFPALALFAAQVLLPNALQSQCSPIPPIQSQVCMPSHLGGGPPICIAQPDRDGDGIPDAIEAKLIERFSPLLRFTIEKDNGSEKYRPMDMVDYVRNSDMVVHKDPKQIVIANSILRNNPAQVITGVNNILTTYEQQNCAPSANLRQVSALQGQLDKHSDNNPDIGTYDQGAEWSVVEAKGNVGMYAHVSPFWPNSMGDLPSHNPRLKDDGTPVIGPSGYETTCQTGPAAQAGKDLCYKIEYYQFFGFNQAWQDFGYANHQADLAMLTEVYDVAKDRILAVSHWAHGYEMRYDLQSAKSTCNDHDFDKLIGEERTCTGENVKNTDFNILYVNLATGSHQSEPWKAQNNQVSFAQDPVTNEYSHPVVFVESGSHEFWPTSKWGAQYAPSHAGNDPFNHYIARNIPNLGEIEHPLSDDAAIIVGYNGYWGNWNKDNDVSPGPSLHSSWNWFVPGRTPIPSQQAER